MPYKIPANILQILRRGLSDYPNLAMLARNVEAISQIAVSLPIPNLALIMIHR